MKQWLAVLIGAGMIFGQQTRNPNQQQQSHPQNNPPQQQTQPQPNPGDVPRQTPGANNPDLQQDAKGSTNTSPKNTNKTQSKKKHKKPV